MKKLFELMMGSFSKVILILWCLTTISCSSSSDTGVLLNKIRELETKISEKENIIQKYESEKKSIIQKYESEKKSIIQKYESELKEITEKLSHEKKQKCTYTATAIMAGIMLLFIGTGLGSSARKASQSKNNNKKSLSEDTK